MSLTMRTDQSEELSFAADVYAFLESLDPSVWREEALHATRDAVISLKETSGTLSEWYARTPDCSDAEARVRAAVETLRSAIPTPEAVVDRGTVLDLLDELTPLYEAMATALSQRGEPVVHLRPTNWARSIVHVCSGLAMMICVEHVFTQTTAFYAAMAWVVWAWSLEITRRFSPRWNDILMSFFSSVSRDHERYRVNAATWYGTALLILTLTAWGPAGVAGLLALAVGDPIAGNIGRRYGRVRLWGGKSLEGALAFAGATWIAVGLYLAAYHPMGWGAWLAILLVSGVVGSITEVMSIRIQDNFSIPVFTAWAVIATQWCLGLPTGF